jgi:hypothetical protein
MRYDTIKCGNILLKKVFYLISACKFIFNDEAMESDDQPLKILALGSYNQAILPSGSCSINFAASRYFKCDGTWTGLGLNSSRIINIQAKTPLSDSDQQSSWEYTLQVRHKISWRITPRFIINPQLTLFQIPRSKTGQVVSARRSKHPSERECYSRFGFT